MEKFHKTVLQKNHLTLVSDIDLSASSVLDNLREDGLISSNEEDAIMAEKTRRNQTSKLLFILKKRDPSRRPYDTLKSALQKDYGFLVEKLETTEKLVDSSMITKNEPEKCTHCELVKRIIPSDVTHTLYENGVLTDDELEELNNDTIPRLSRAQRLLDLLGSKSDEEEVTTHLQNSLKIKYNSLVDKHDGATLNYYTKCQCRTSKTTIDKTNQENTEPSLGSREQLYNNLNEEHKSNVHVLKSVLTLTNNIQNLAHESNLQSIESNELQSSFDEPCKAIPQEQDENSVTSIQHITHTRYVCVERKETVVNSLCRKRIDEYIENNSSNMNKAHAVCNAFEHDLDLGDLGKTRTSDKCLICHESHNHSSITGRSCPHQYFGIQEPVQHSFYFQSSRPSYTSVGQCGVPHSWNNTFSHSTPMLSSHVNARRRGDKRKSLRKRSRLLVTEPFIDTKGYDDVDGNPVVDDTGQETGLSAAKDTCPAECDNELMLVKCVNSVLPNNKKLMRKCSRLWDQLFFLREKGDWTTHSLVTKKAFEKFSDNPDIKVLLYRSEMCISTFYKNDQIKALDMFDKALEHLPMTEMPNWHLTRILPLKVELCTRSKKYDEASSLLDDAKQAMVSLGPCLSTGAVYFFEAMYLGNILQCTRRDTKSAEGISQQVKKCFLTAIEHYNQEGVFSVRSFLNQVYLFLALFSLGVDCKKIRYMSIHEDVKPEDISLAEHYLSLFENNCWSDSTIWSRMLFYVGRGEQHKLIHNFERSLDYFRDAKLYAEKGSFGEHVEFIASNIQLVGERLCEQMRLQALKEESQTAEDILKKALDSSSESGSCAEN